MMLANVQVSRCVAYVGSDWNSSAAFLNGIQGLVVVLLLMETNISDTYVGPLQSITSTYSSDWKPCLDIWMVVKKYGAFLDPYYNTEPNIQGTLKGTIILTATHIGFARMCCTKDALHFPLPRRRKGPTCNLFRLSYHPRPLGYMGIMEKGNTTL